MGGKMQRTRCKREDLRTVELSLVVGTKLASNLREQLVRLVNDFGGQPVGGSVRELTDEEWNRVE
jgi:hypothetical protein